MADTTPDTVNSDIAAARRRALTASLLGNYMEWYDFAVYGFVAVNIAHSFFPSDDPATGLMSSLAVFAVAFFFRPFGGAIFGAIGDRVGRRVSLALAIIVMSAATAALAALPTYESIGILAPALLVVVRCIQGMSVGGEWTGVSAFIVEWAPDNRRGLWASAISATSAAGLATGALLVLALNTWLPPRAMDEWGWRVPFLVAIPMGIAGLYMRLKLEDTPVYREMRAQQSVVVSPIRTALRTDWRSIVLVLAYTAVGGLGFYYFVTYMVNHLSQTVGMARVDAIMISTASLVVYFVLCPVAGLLSDRIGRRPTFLLGCLGHLCLTVPVFLLLGTANVLWALLALCIFSVSQALLNVMNSVALIELFPPHTRMTSAAIGYNIGVGPIAGSGPLIAAALVAATGNPVSPAMYLSAVALVVGTVMWFVLPETYQRSLTNMDAPVLKRSAKRLEHARRSHDAADQ